MLAMFRREKMSKIEVGDCLSFYLKFWIKRYSWENHYFSHSLLDAT